MSKYQAMQLLIKAYRKYGGGSPQHIKALKRYDKIAGTWSDYKAMESEE